MFANYTYADLQDDLTGIVGGIDLAKITNFESLVERAGRNVVSRIDPPSTIRRHLLTIYQDEYDYSVPSSDDFKKAVDFRPQVNRDESDNINETFTEQFDLRKQRLKSLLSSEWRDGTQFFRISKDVESRSVIVHNFDSLTDNGTWSAVVGGGASNLSINTLYKKSGSGSLEFDVGATGGAIENTSLSSLDLTDHDERGSFFLRMFIPLSFTISNLTSVNLRWGNSDTVYWSRTVTAPHFGSFNYGWNTLRFDWDGATETGTVDPSAIDYARITITTTAADTGFLVDDLTCKLGEVYEMLYYSKFLFRTSAGVWQESISDDGDIINLDIDSRNILVYECEAEIAKQLRDDDMKLEAREELFGGVNKIGLYDEYKNNHPSEAMKKRGTYYRI